MKIKTPIIFLLLLAACNSPKKEGQIKVKGVYVSTYESEYSRAMDTIEISPLKENADTYYYIRRTGYHRIANGVLGPYHYNTENSTCVFDKRKAQLNEQKHGRVYFLSDNGSILISNNSIYRRIQ